MKEEIFKVKGYTIKIWEQAPDMEYEKETLRKSFKDKVPMDMRY